MISAPTSLKVLSYNIHKGFSLGSRAFVLGRIKEAIRQVHADVVFLQEVLGAHRRHAKRIHGWPTSPQFEFLADEVWPHFAYGKNAVYDDGNHGNAILSKFPIHAWSNVDISSGALESRGFLHALVNIPGTRKRFHCVCVHLGLLKRWRKTQLEKILARLEAEVRSDEALIVAGDFNDWSEKATDFLSSRFAMREAFHELYGDHPRTFPAKFPLLKLDRIYFRNLTLERAVICVGKPWEKLSDHAALYAEFSTRGM